MNYEIFNFHAIAGISPLSGGTSRVVVDLTDALAGDPLIQPVIITQSLVDKPTLPSMNSRVQRIVAYSSSRNALRLGLPFRAALNKEIGLKKRTVSLIHSHGLWLPVNHWSCRFARKNNIALIIQPHGMLEPWALQHRATKKRIAMTLFQHGDLECAQALVATSQEEYRNIRTLGFWQPIAVIPNGVKINIPGESVVSCLPKEREQRTVLFLSRIHPKKGLENLIRAWASVAPTGWLLRIAGPDEGGYLQTVIGLIKELGVENTVEYVGMVNSEHKSSVFNNSDVFVLPTFSENFGVVVAEALAHGIPVITTRGAPWQDLERFDCGWWVDIGVEPLAAALEKAISLTDQERRAMGVRGLDYVRRYEWGAIAKQTIELYSWVLGQGAMPDFVFTD